MSDMRQYITSFMRRNALSMSKLALCLGYPSKTSIERIMNGDAKEKSIRAFETRLNATFSLSEKEKSALDEAVQIAVYGYGAYLSNRAMWEFLHGVARDGADVDIEDVDSGETQYLAQRYSNATNIRITLLNCYDVPLFSQLKVMLQRLNARVDHYIYVNGDTARTIRAVSALSPVFYEKGYYCYTIDGHAADGEDVSFGVESADILVSEYVDEKGTSREDMIVFDSPSHGNLSSRASQAGGFVRVLGLRRDRISRAKRTYFECGAFDDYIKYSMDYAKLEYNRAVYKIKPDIGVDFIEADILAPAVFEGPIEMNEKSIEVFKELKRIYSARNRNAFTKRKPSYIILKENAMRRFAQTGKTSDHFWGMRPFTPNERARILTKLLEQQQDNPYFHLYFLRDDDSLRDVEIASYENTGILMLDANTDYNLSNGHSEVMITHQEFINLFEQFFRQTLIKKAVVSDVEAREILKSLIESCANY